HCGGVPSLIANRESDTLVLGVREQVNNSAAPAVGVDLHGVAGEVFEKASVVALIGRRVVERRIRKGQDGSGLALREGGGKLKQKGCSKQEHVTFSGIERLSLGSKGFRGCILRPSRGTVIRDRQE